MAHVPTAERRPQLVRAAIDLMAREGVAAGSTRAIAAELGVAQGTVHYAFGTKKDLYRAVIQQLTADLVDRVRAAAPGRGPFADQVRALVAALWDGVLEDDACNALLDEFQTLAARDPDLQDIVQAHQHEIEGIAASMLTDIAEADGIALALPAGDAAALFLSSFFGLLSRHRLLTRAGEDPAPQTLALIDSLVTAITALCLGAPST
ncbi:hypothetical protein GCM10022221_35260 [Actinocorallia aurea]